MNEHALPISEKELSAMCIEEQIIARSKTNYKRLPMMEELFSQFEASLTITLNEYTSCKSDVILKSFDYMSCAKALETFSKPSIFGISSAKPWGGLLTIVAESNLVFTMLQTMLGGQPSSNSQKSRNFTGIEKRITSKFYDIILHVLGRKFTEVTSVAFQIDKLEEDPAELSFAPMDSACVKVTLEILLEGQGGQITFIIPYITFEQANAAFSQPFRGGDINGEAGWHTAMTKSLQGADIELTAVLQELKIPLHEVLAWRPGRVLDIGIDTEHELLVNCAGKQMFHAAMGCRKNGSVALRISQILSEMES